MTHEKYLRAIKLTVGLILVVGCSENPKDLEKENPNRDKVKEISMDQGGIDSTINNAILLKPNAEKKYLTNHSVISFKTFEKDNVDLNPSSKDYNKCKQWSLDSSFAKTIMRGMVPISGYESIHHYLDLGCSYYGECYIDGQIAKYRIGSASWLAIEYPDTTINYGDENKKFEKYFLASKISMR